MTEKEFLKLKEDVKELTRRIDTLATQLHANDSEYNLRQLNELKKTLENQEIRTAMNDTSLHILLYTVQSLQRSVYPLSELYEKHKAKKELRAQTQHRSKITFSCFSIKFISLNQSDIFGPYSYLSHH